MGGDSKGFFIFSLLSKIFQIGFLSPQPIAPIVSTALSFFQNKTAGTRYAVTSPMITISTMCVFCQYILIGLFLSMHRHTGQGSAATADPVSSATVKRRSLLPLYCGNKEQNASRFGICAGFRLSARYRSLGRNDAESLGSGKPLTSFASSYS